MDLRLVEADGQAGHGDWTIWLKVQQRRAINIILATTAGLGLLAVGLSTVMWLQGRSVNFLAYSAAYTSLLLLILVSRRISEKMASFGYLLLLFLFGVYSFSAGWLASSARTIFLLTVVLATLLFNQRVGIYVAVGGIVTYAGFAAAYMTGWMPLKPLPEPNTFTPIFIEGVGFLLVMSLVTISQWYFGQALKAASNANQQAQKSRTSFHNIVERSADGILVLDRQGRVLFANRAVEVFFQRSLDELYGEPSGFDVPPNGTAEVVIYRPNESPGIAEVRLDQTEWEGQPAYLAILRDITDRKQAEQNLSAAHSDLQDAYDRTIEGWVRALDLRDHETEGHTKRVLEMTVRLAVAFGFSDEQIVHIRRGALLHDIGKIGVCDKILLKPGPLDEAEWEVMRRHPTLARDLIAPIQYLTPAITIPYYHHEHWDGSGYPQGLQGEKIPLEARLFSVVDVWDALSSDRPYRKKCQPQDAIAYLREQSGKQFDPRCVEVFLALLGEG